MWATLRCKYKLCRNANIASFYVLVARLLFTLLNVEWIRQFYVSKKKVPLRDIYLKHNRRRVFRVWRDIHFLKKQKLHSNLSNFYFFIIQWKTSLLLCSTHDTIFYEFTACLNKYVFVRASYFMLLIYFGSKNILLS